MDTAATSCGAGKCKCTPGFHVFFPIPENDGQKKSHSEQSCLQLGILEWRGDSLGGGAWLVLGAPGGPTNTSFLDLVGAERQPGWTKAAGERLSLI